LDGTPHPHHGSFIAKRCLAEIELAGRVPIADTHTAEARQCFNRDDEWDVWMKEPIDSRQLRAFVTLVNTGSFTQTAKQLFLSQSAISHSIKELVKLGLGISAMAPWTVRGELRQKTLVTLPLGKKKIATQLGPPASSRQKTHAGGGNVCDVEPIHLHLVC
jgi:hypothetical protein